MPTALDRLFRSRTLHPKTPPPHIAYDQYSMIIDGQRTIIRSGAFHYYRLPAPDLWKDRLLKLKRAGYNTVDLYFFWGYHSPAEGVYDFTGPRDVDRLLDVCEELGLYVIARPGPYINSELDGGGQPAWLLAQTDIPLRCVKDGAYIDSPRYLAYTRQWYGHIVPRLAKRKNVILFQIENEYFNDDMNPAYMRFLYDLARELGITVPICHNDGFKEGCWADLVDVYGVDDYQLIFFADDWRGDGRFLQTLDRLEEVKRQFCANSPLAIFELQGGWFDPWTGIGYDQMRRRLGRESLELTTWTAIAQGTTIYSHYMFVGGTNWNHIGAPVVYSSYDFAAPVHEWGGVSERYHAAKAIATLVGSFEELFALSEPADDVQASDAQLFYKARRQGDAHLVFLRNLSGETRSTTLTIGGIETPPVALGPWSMRPVLVNVPFVDARVTATCNVFTALHKENQHLVAFHGLGRVIWTLPASCRLLRDELHSTVDGNRVAISYDGQGWKDVVFSSGGHRYRSVFMPTADDAWRVDDYLVLGPSYVGESRRKGGVTDLPRDEMRVQSPGPGEKTIRVYSVGHLNRAEINDKMVFASYDSIAGYLRFDLPRVPEVKLPALGPWRVTGAAPELGTEQTAGWTAIPPDGSLEMDRLGIYRGFAWYRGTYSGRMANMSLCIRHNAAVYLNGRFVTRLDNYSPEQFYAEPESAEPQPVDVALPTELQHEGENALAVLVESLGHNKGFLYNERFPRGILAVRADRPIAWSVRAGVTGEAEGYWQPACDDSAWAEASDLGQTPADDLVWARTRFALDLPKDAYAPLGLWLEGVAHKAHIYLNGVLVARDWSVCPQRHFYLPEGVLNLHGENVLALLLWRRGDKPAAGTVRLQAYCVQATNYVNVL